MKRTQIYALAVVGASVLSIPTLAEQAARPAPKMSEVEYEVYKTAIDKTAQMVGNPAAQGFAGKLGLNILNVTWEDPGRYKGSSVGPNISDMTIQVALENPKTKELNVTCMPVIRFPNFSDLTCDLDPHYFTILVGNQKDQALKRVSLFDLLQSPTRFMNNPDSWKGQVRSLLAERDSKVLVSAQACFLPVPKQGKATFNPVLFNYQSMEGDPAVLTVLCTREGTSMTVIDNKRDAFSTGSVWGQRLFHNDNGMRASLTGERLSDFKTKGGSTADPKGGVSTTEDALNMVLLIQIPLKQKNEMRFKGGMPGGGAGGWGGAGLEMESGAKRSDVENAVIGHGDLEGPFTEIGGLDIKRDDRYPVRVTVQFYKATSNGEVTEKDIQEIKGQIDRVYAQSDYVGSLVTQGNTGRVTEYDGCKVQPKDWWDQFWIRHQANTGDTKEEAMAKLRKLLGRYYMRRPVNELYLHNVLK